jgi:hypothetical protein
MKKIIIFMILTFILFSCSIAKKNVFGTNKFGDKILTEIYNINNLNDIKNLNKNNDIMNLSIDISPSKNYIFFACDTLLNDECQVFGNKIKIINHELQFIYDVKNKKVINKGFKYCNSMFVVCRWYEKDFILLLDIGTSLSRGYVIYDIKKEKEIFNGKGTDFRLKEDGDTAQIYFSNDKKVIAFNSWTESNNNVDGEDYFKYIILIKRNEEKIIEIRPDQKDIQYIFRNFKKNNQIEFCKYKLNKDFSLNFEKENDKSLIYKY